MNTFKELRNTSQIILSARIYFEKVRCFLNFSVPTKHDHVYNTSYVISWSGNSVETHSFCRISGDSSKNLRKLCGKFPHKEIR